MKKYGAFKSTEFSKKQIGVIYSKAKAGELKVEKWVISEFYNMADYYGYDDNGSVESRETDILEILENVFADNLEIAQKQIDDYTEKELNRMSVKNKKSVDRNLLS